MEHTGTVASELSKDVATLHARIKELQRALAQADAARNEAQAACNDKDAFLAMVSHELRGPLAAISGWAQVLRSAPGELANALDVIERNARIQRSLIDELMDVSRANTTELTVSLSPVALDAVVRQVVDAATPVASEREQRIAVSTDSVPTVILGDAQRLHQIVSNLLSNALKFTAAGGHVKLTLSSVGEFAELEVKDTGIGIEAELLEHMFEPFWQARRSSSAYRGGLGLGLSIVRRLVHLHGGTIRAMSEGTDRGTRIIVRFELAGNEDRPTADRRRAERRRS
jgi:two-component system CheB/CheR fusion protein